MARYGVWAPIPQRVGNTTKWATGHNGRKLTAVVIHRMEGTLMGSDSYLRREFADYYPYPRLNASTHFGIGNWNGYPQVRQWVDTANSAWGWAARPTRTPSALAQRTLTNIWSGYEDLNWQVISIEVEGFHYQPWNQRWTPSLNGLLRWIQLTHGDLTIMVHNDCSVKPCPGLSDFKNGLPGYYGAKLSSIFAPQPPTGDKDEMSLHYAKYQIPKLVTLKGGSILYEFSTGTQEHYRIPAGTKIQAELFATVGTRYLGRRFEGGPMFFFNSSAIDTSVRSKKASYR